MRSHSVRSLLANDARELSLSRATLVFALALGPLVGHAFSTAVSAYAEASGSQGGPAALAQGLSPLDGVVVPTLGAYAIAATLLLPFVALTIVAREKESGAHALLLQAPASLGVRVTLKMAALLAAWIVAWLPGLVALTMWRAAGGHLNGPETLTVFLGHLVHGALVIAIGIAAAAVTDGAGSAAVLALAVTLGGWALDFAGAVRGGTVARLAAFTPDAGLRTFEQGEISASVVAVSLAAIVAAVMIAVVWMDPARSARRKLALTGFVAIAAGGVGAAGAGLRASRDVSEDRRNSFDRGDERALAAIRAPLRVTAHLALEDPRYTDLERGVLRKLERTMPDVRVAVASSSMTGLFDRDSMYGQVWYELGGRKAMSRSATPAIVLETIYGLAGVSPPDPDAAGAYSGYPLRTPPGGAWFLFYIGWPIGVAVSWLGIRRRRAR